MQLIHKKAELLSFVEDYKKQGSVIGFVPTMGALHQGHLSLVERSNKDCDKTIISIFINPLQFNDKNDFKNYPYNLQNDIELLSPYNVDIIFAPTYDEIYTGYTIRNFDLGNLNDILEGAYRPGHFNGVANVVYRLFEIVKPNKAYFGKKDYQQIFVVKKINSDYKFLIDIIECPIIREVDGLAMSSRNRLLAPQYRKRVSILSESLFYVRDNFNKYSLVELKKYVKDVFLKEKQLQLDYFEFINLDKFELIDSKENCQNILACIAVYAGNVRLIDNININL